MLAAENIISSSRAPSPSNLNPLRTRRFDTSDTCHPGQTVAAASATSSNAAAAGSTGRPRAGAGRDRDRRAGDSVVTSRRPPRAPGSFAAFATAATARFGRPRNSDARGLGQLTSPRFFALPRPGAQHHFDIAERGRAGSRRDRPGRRLRARPALPASPRTCAGFGRDHAGARAACPPRGPS